MKWMVFDSRMNVIGTVFASNYTLAWIEARSQFRNADYIQEM